MTFIKVTLIFLLLTVAYLTHVLSKLDVTHIESITLTFLTITSLITAITGLSKCAGDDDGNDVDDLSGGD
jgi:uncharacterized protein YybS (DUF2232 family)